MRGDIQPQVDSLNVTVISLAESLSARLDALTASLISSQSTQLSSQPWLGPDVGEPQPGETAGTRCTFQALGVPNGTPVVPPNVGHPFGQGYRAAASEQLGSASAPPPPSAPLQLLRLRRLRVPLRPPPPPPRYGDPPPQPSTSGWVPFGPPPTRTRRDSRTSSESEASHAESDVSFRDSSSSRLADLIYEVCPDSRPLSDAAALKLSLFRPARVCGLQAALPALPQGRGCGVGGCC